MPELFISNWEILLRLACATFCGAIFGIERRHKNKPVGARTHILVCIAACEIAIISAYGFLDSFHAYHSSMDVTSDPARLVVGVLTGIGFLGAGIIYKSPSGSIHGITTAAEVFLIACIGIGFGLGLYFLTWSVAVIAIFTLLVDRFRMFLQKRNEERPSCTDSDKNGN